MPTPTAPKPEEDNSHQYNSIIPYMHGDYLNNGSYQYGWVTATATAKFLGGYLIAKIFPTFTAYKSTGEYSRSLTSLICTAQLTWYFGDFYLFGWYTTPSSSLSDSSGYKEKIPARYQLQIGWGRGTWKASATAYNFLRSSWETSHQTLASRYYQSDIRTYGTGQHMRFQFSLTYTFGYGKKVRHADEVTASGTGTSAILK